MMEIKNELIDIEDSYTTKRDVAIPEKSKPRYEATYAFFKKWCVEKHLEISQKVMVAYLVERSTKLKSPNSLWTEYSMLKCTINLNDAVDISKYAKVLEFLKSKNTGYRPKKSQIFSTKDMYRFLTEAPDDTYLIMKVALIISVAGACRKQELCDLTIDDIEDKGSVIIIRLSKTETKYQRSFTIVNHNENQIHFLDIYRKYANLRPQRTTSRRFFMKYHNGRCFNQVVGKNTMGSYPCKIATYLNKPNAKDYTGQALRKTSLTMLANKGVDVLALSVRKSPEIVMQPGSQILGGLDFVPVSPPGPSSSGSSLPSVSFDSSIDHASLTINNIEVINAETIATHVEKNRVPIVFNNYASNCSITFNVN